MLRPVRPRSSSDRHDDDDGYLTSEESRALKRAKLSDCKDIIPLGYQTLCRPFGVYDGDTVTIGFYGPPGDWEQPDSDDKRRSGSMHSRGGGGGGGQRLLVKDNCRMLRYDTPELRGKTEYERKLAYAARDRMRSLLQTAQGPAADDDDDDGDYGYDDDNYKRKKREGSLFKVTFNDMCNYGRSLVLIQLPSGCYVHEAMLREQLGRPMKKGMRRQKWEPDECSLQTDLVDPLRNAVEGEQHKDATPPQHALARLVAALMLNQRFVFLPPEGYGYEALLGQLKSLVRSLLQRCGVVEPERMLRQAVGKEEELGQPLMTGLGVFRALFLQEDEIDSAFLRRMGGSAGLARFWCRSVMAPYVIEHLTTPESGEYALVTPEVWAHAGAASDVLTHLDLSLSRDDPDAEVLLLEGGAAHRNMLVKLRPYDAHGGSWFVASAHSTSDDAASYGGSGGALTRAASRQRDSRLRDMVPARDSVAYVFEYYNYLLSPRQFYKTFS